MKVNAWWSGELTFAGGSSPEQRAAPDPVQSKPAALLSFLSWHPLSSWTFLPGLGAKSSAAVKSKRTKRSQQENHILPKAERGDGAASSGSGCSVDAGDCARQIRGQMGPRAAGKVLIQNKQKPNKKARLGLKEGLETGPSSVLFSECIQNIGESSHLGQWSLAVPQSFSVVPGTLRSTCRTYPSAAVLHPQLSLPKCIHSS